jgi:hypothetical protein
MTIVFHLFDGLLRTGGGTIMADKTYNHVFDIAFSIGGSKCPNGTDITVKQIIEALQKRIEEVKREDTVLEAVGAPVDTYEE